MNLSEKLNNNTGLAITIASLLIIGAAVVLTSQMGGSGGRIADQDYYTDDDGQTYFADAAGKDVPFQHNGKEAVAAFVYRSGGKTSVHYMMRKHPGGKPRGAAKQEDPDTASDDRAPSTGRREYKRPGENEWKPQPPGPIPTADKSQPEWITP